MEATFDWPTTSVQEMPLLLEFLSKPVRRIIWAVTVALTVAKIQDTSSWPTQLCINDLSTLKIHPSCQNISLRGRTQRLYKDAMCGSTGIKLLLIFLLAVSQHVCHAPE